MPRRNHKHQPTWDASVESPTTSSFASRTFASMSTCKGKAGGKVRLAALHDAAKPDIELVGVRHAQQPHSLAASHQHQSTPAA